MLGVVGDARRIAPAPVRIDRVAVDQQPVVEGLWRSAKPGLLGDLARAGDAQRLIERIAEIIITEFDVDWVKVTLSKPGAIRNSRDVGVAIERVRADYPPAG